MTAPTTSTTLLECLGRDSQSARWGDFVARYEAPMREFLASRFPFVPADDIIQETFIALVERMPHYVYSPKEHGHFRNYIFGTLRHKAMRHLREKDRESAALKAYASSAQAAGAGDDDPDEKDFRDSVYELALAELLADTSIHDQTKQIFIRTAINGERPDSVAAAFGVTRNSVDQTKNRMIAKLRQIKDKLLDSR